MRTKRSTRSWTWLALHVRTLTFLTSLLVLKAGYRWDRRHSRKIYTREMREGLKVHSSVKMRLEMLTHSDALSRSREDTHVRVTVSRSESICTCKELLRSPCLKI